MSLPGSSTPIGPRYDKPGAKKRSPAALLMYAFIAVLLGVTAIAGYARFAPRMQSVPNKVSEGFQEDRINILLIGIGGDTHPGEGKALADAMILASLQPSTKKVALVSLPRDLYVHIDGTGMQRLNAAHSLGEEGALTGRGPGLLVRTVEETLGLPVHAYARVDFLAFEKTIDALGGIEVDVKRPIYDTLFKDGFEKGRQTMSGKRALRYARYRHIVDRIEGDNFGRELRQQQVIDAVRNKLQNLGPKQALRLAKLALSSSDYASTNLTAPQMAELYGTFRHVEKDEIRQVSLRKLTRVVQIRDPRTAGEAVVPIGGDFGQIRGVVANLFAPQDETTMRLTNGMPPPLSSADGVQSNPSKAPAVTQ